jgi:hypothetical protein
MLKLLPFLIGTCLSLSVAAQCDSIASKCERHIAEKYISDGQSYKALLSGSEIAEFQTTLFGGNTYRIAACSGAGDSNLIFRILDEQKNMLFSNKEFSNAPFWDFVVENTMVVTIESTLDETRSSSGCAVIVLGFKR